MAEKYKAYLEKSSKGSSAALVKTITEQKRVAYQLSKPEIQTNAKMFGYHDLAVATWPQKRMRDEYFERLSLHERVMDMGQDDVLNLAVAKSIDYKKLKGRDMGDIVYVILSGGFTEEEVSEAEGQQAEKEEEGLERLLAKWEKVDYIRDNLGDIRTKYHRDLAQKGLTQDKVAAAIIGLIDESLMRIGTGKYSQEYGTYGASSLSPEMITINPKDQTVEFDYTGKKQVTQHQRITDKAVFNAIMQIQNEAWAKGKGCYAGGQPRFFCYKKGDKYYPITADNVRDYMEKISGQRSVHAFRFVHGTNIVLEAMAEGKSYSDAVKEAALALGHKRTDKKTKDLVPDTGQTAQKSYIDPRIIVQYSKGRGERNPAYFRARQQISTQCKVKTDGWGRREIIDYLKKNPKCKVRIQD